VNREPDEPSGPDPAADEFEAIVAGWRREGAVPTWPGDDRPPAEPPRTPPFAAPAVGPVPHRPYEPESDRFEHFVPPEPPPLPRLGPPILVGLTLIGLGLVLVTFPGWVGVPQVYGLPLGLVAIAAGLGWLVLRLWPDPDDVPPPLYLDDPDDPDGGAVL
jgi:hypothetical protein